MEEELLSVVHTYCKEHKIHKIPDAFRINENGNIEMGLLTCDDVMHWFPKATLPTVLEHIVDKFLTLIHVL